MSFDSRIHSGRLRRLADAQYRGGCAVHWSMTTENRGTGWLDALHHARVRERLIHVSARYQIACPTYCLMPDHGHFLWFGWSDGSDQKRAVKVFREAWNDELRRSAEKLQAQGYDHVLREDERERGAFMRVATYVLENPVRAGLVSRWSEWPFSGAIVPGYSRMDPREGDFWERFWRIFGKLSGGADERE